MIGAALLALIAANSTFADAYRQLIHWKIGLSLPRVGVMDFREWVADGLMAIFFLLVGLEVK